jgi:hypothetical protein
MLPDPWWIHCVATDVRSGGMSRERTQPVSPVWGHLRCRPRRAAGRLWGREHMHKLIAMRCRPAPSTAPFSPPQAWEINGASIFAGEVFGPILHVVRWRADRLIDEIAATGYGLTLGIHSRIDETVRHILARLKVGNSYINRSMIGAVVGVSRNDAAPAGAERRIAARGARRRAVRRLGSALFRYELPHAAHSSRSDQRQDCGVPPQISRRGAHRQPLDPGRIFLADCSGSSHGRT